MSAMYNKASVPAPWTSLVTTVTLKPGVAVDWMPWVVVAVSCVAETVEGVNWAGKTVFTCVGAKVGNILVFAAGVDIQLVGLAVNVNWAVATIVGDPRVGAKADFDGEFAARVEIYLVFVDEIYISWTFATKAEDGIEINLAGVGNDNLIRP